MSSEDSKNVTNVVYPSSVEVTQHTETPEMSQRREKYNLINLDKEAKIAKGLTIGGAITTAAMAAITALGIIAVPAEALVYGGAITLAGGINWLMKKMDLDSMIKASTDQPIQELANEMRSK